MGGADRRDDLGGGGRRGPGRPGMARRGVLTRAREWKLALCMPPISTTGGDGPHAGGHVVFAQAWGDRLYFAAPATAIPALGPFPFYRRTTTPGDVVKAKCVPIRLRRATRRGTGRRTRCRSSAAFRAAPSGAAGRHGGVHAMIEMWRVHGPAGGAGRGLRARWRPVEGERRHGVLSGAREAELGRRWGRSRGWCARR